MTVSYIDIGVLAVIALCLLAGYRRGFVRTVFKALSFFAAIWLSYLLYPHVGRVLRQTPLYARISEYFINLLDIRALVAGAAAGAGAGVDQSNAVLQGLSLPGMLLEPLTRFATPDVYELLNVDTLEGYIGGFLANIVLQFIAMVAVFFVMFLLMSILGNVLNTAARLPVVNLLNRAGGAAAGLVMGLVFVWAALTVVNLFFANASYPEVQRLMADSVAAKWFLTYNWLFQVVARGR